MTAADMASLDYGMYSLSSNGTVSQYSTDSSSVSKQYFDLSDISGANDALNSEKSVAFSSIANIESYSENLLQASQLSCTGTISNGENSSISELLSGNTDSSSLLNIINVNTDAIRAYAESVLTPSQPNSCTLNNYESYLQDSSSSGLDLLV
ncbi:MAG TPA: hypothetical protein VHP31_02030 [Caproicibacter sp.]|nr:hypothetical protein [Caproicibacter sp.]